MTNADKQESLLIKLQNKNFKIREAKGTLPGQKGIPLLNVKGKDRIEQNIITGIQNIVLRNSGASVIDNTRQIGLTFNNAAFKNADAAEPTYPFGDVSGCCPSCWDTVSTELGCINMPEGWLIGTDKINKIFWAGNLGRLYTTLVDVDYSLVGAKEDREDKIVIGKFNKYKLKKEYIGCQDADAEGVTDGTLTNTCYNGSSVPFGEVLDKVELVIPSKRRTNASGEVTYYGRGAYTAFVDPVDIEKSIFDVLANLDLMMLDAIETEYDSIAEAILQDPGITNVHWGGDATNVSELGQTAGVDYGMTYTLLLNSLKCLGPFKGGDKATIIMSSTQWFSLIASLIGANLWNDPDNVIRNLYKGLTIIVDDRIPSYLSGAEDTNEEEEGTSANNEWGCNGEVAIMGKQSELLSINSKPAGRGWGAIIGVEQMPRKFKEQSEKCKSVLVGVENNIDGVNAEPCNYALIKTCCENS